MAGKTRSATKIRAVSSHPKPERAWPLLVVSSSDQADTLAHQRAWALETAKQKAWKLERVGDFEDVSSGNKGPRKLVRRLLAEIARTPQNERPQWVLMIRLDRIGRGDIVESQVVVYELKQLGVRVWTRDQGEVKNDSAMEQLMVAIAATVSRMENDVKREKATSTHARKKREGKHTGGIPYGMVLIEHRLRPFEPQASFVRDLFGKRSEGWGMLRLAKYARAEAPPKPLRDGTKEMRWTTGTMARVLVNTAYRGTVVPEELFDEVQGIRKPGIRRESKYPFPLRGAIRCTCGATLTTTAGGDERYRVRYYVCRDSVHTEYPHHNADHLEAQFLERLRSPQIHEELLEAGPRADIKPLLESQETLKGQIAELDARRARTFELYEDGTIPKDEVAERLKTLLGEREKFAVELERVEQEITATTSAQRARDEILGALSRLADNWERVSDIELRRQTALAIADAVGGMFVAPPGPKGAKRGVIQFGPGQLELRHHRNRAGTNAVSAKWLLRVMQA